MKITLAPNAQEVSQMLPPQYVDLSVVIQTGMNYGTPITQEQYNDYYDEALDAIQEHINELQTQITEFKNTWAYLK
jgi:hypothetical protein